MGDPALVAVAMQRRPAFAAADVNFDAGLVHSLQLVHELARAVRKLLFFELAEDAVMKRARRPLPLAHFLFVKVDELRRRSGEELTRFWADVELRAVRRNLRADGAV